MRTATRPSSSVFWRGIRIRWRHPDTAWSRKPVKGEQPSSISLREAFAANRRVSGRVVFRAGRFSITGHGRRLVTYPTVRNHAARSAHRVVVIPRRKGTKRRRPTSSGFGAGEPNLPNPRTTNRQAAAAGVYPKLSLPLHADRTSDRARPSGQDVARLAMKSVQARSSS